MKILVTGANGFLGSHIVEQAAQKGFAVYGAIREGADLSNLETVSGYSKLFLDYQNDAQVRSSLTEKGPFDLIIHNAGLTKAFSLEKYEKVNVKLTEKLTDWIKECKCLKPGGTLVYVSSMAARGPVGSNGPVSNYGRSKLKAEKVITSSGLPFMIFRPTAIYGLRDVQFLPLIKAIKMGLYPLMTSPKQKMTLINAKDVAQNIIDLPTKHQNQTVHLDDGNVYQHKDLKSTLEKITGKKSISLFLPKFLVIFFLLFSDLLNRIFKKTPAVSVEQYNEISKDWNFDLREERQNLPLTIKYSLLKGFEEAFNFYKQKKLL